MTADTDLLTLYHGGTEKVEFIDLSKSRTRLDFGKGFYTTTSYDQSVRWSELKSNRLKSDTKRKVVSVYSVKSIENLRIQKFNEANYDWLEFVVNNRLGNIQHNYDLVIGPIANDLTLLVVNAYMNGIYGVGKSAAEQAINLLKPELLENQYAFCTENAISKLIFTRCYYL